MPTTAKYLGNILDIVPAFGPVDLQTAANDGDWVSMKNCHSIIIKFHSMIGTAGDDPTLTIEQAINNAGGSSKNFAVADEIYTKQSATDLLSTGTWTRVSQTAGATYTDGDSAEQEAVWAIEIRASELDVANGFDFIRARVADVGANAQLGSCDYILCGLSHPNAPENVLSPL